MEREQMEFDVVIVGEPVAHRNRQHCWPAVPQSTAELTGKSRLFAEQPCRE